MFSAQELEYIKALIETMRGKGYNYYVAHTVTENNNDSDVVVIFSQEPITGNGLYNFTVTDGIQYTVDSSGYNTYGGGDARTQVSSRSGNISIADTEFIYTNAEYSGTSLQPDIRTTGGVISETNQASFYMLTLFFLVVVVFSIFRGG